MEIDAYSLLMCTLTGLLAGGFVLVALVLPVEDRAADETQGKGPMDASSTFNRLPLHYRLFHSATTAHWRSRGLLPLLRIARGLFLCSFALGLGGLIWLSWT